VVTVQDSTPGVLPTSGPVSTEDLSRILANRRWQWRRWPFPHVVAQQLFIPAVHQRLTAAFRAIMDGRDDKSYNAKHDFVGASLTRANARDLSIFLSPGWHDAITGLFGIESTGQVTVGLHRHRPSSRYGFPHNDIVPERLAENNRPDEIINHASPNGSRRSDGPRVRAIAAIYYLNNGPWRPGNGGETGLYLNWDNPVTEPVTRIPPVDNSLLAFECSPYSYHSFLANRQRRDSVIVFFYRAVDNFIDLWGAAGLQQYAGRGRHAI
jgi:hypothetical protein